MVFFRKDKTGFIAKFHRTCLVICSLERGRSRLIAKQIQYIAKDRKTHRHNNMSDIKNESLRW